MHELKHSSNSARSLRDVESKHNVKQGQFWIITLSLDIIKPSEPRVIRLQDGFLSAPWFNRNQSESSRDTCVCVCAWLRISYHCLLESSCPSIIQPEPEFINIALHVSSLFQWQWGVAHMKEMNPSEKLISLSGLEPRPNPDRKHHSHIPFEADGGSALPTWLKSHSLNGMMGNASILFQMELTSGSVMPERDHGWAGDAMKAVTAGGTHELIRWCHVPN